jgi:predicted metal-dependent enzyme (double-stranded beta helix superfamily)
MYSMLAMRSGRQARSSSRDGSDSGHNLAPPSWRCVTFDLETFIDDCKRALGESTPMLAVKELVERAVADPAGVAKALPEKGVTVMVRSPDLTVVSVVVPGGLPKARSIPHDHRMWAVVGIYAGQEDNEFFRRTDQSLVGSGGRSLRMSDSLVMGDDTIHAVHNPLDHGSLAAIHVYGGDLVGTQRSMWTEPGYVEQPYDETKVVGRGGFRQSPA